MSEGGVTIYDVARLAGCAPSTVSRAFSRPGRVSAATHARVMDAARELGYRTEAAATQDAPGRGRQRRLGIELPDLTNPYFAEVVAGMQEAAHEADYLLLLLDSLESGERERSNLERALDVVDGLVLAGSRLSDAALTQLAKQRPVVVLNRRVAGLDSIVADHEHGMHRVMQHLAGTGVRSVVYAAGPVNSWSDGERWRTARAAAQEAGIVIRRLGPFPPTSTGGAEAYRALREDAPDAVVAYNDLLAAGLLMAALADGIDVPGELAVVGHDDIALAPLVGPGLSTLAIPKQRQGRAAIERLVARIERPSSVRGVTEGVLPVQLRVRGSSDRRPAGDGVR